MTIDVTNPETARGVDVIQMVATVATLSRAVELDTVNELLDQESYHALVPILDPTRYINDMRNPNREINLKLLTGFRAWRKVCDETHAAVMALQDGES